MAKNTPVTTEENNAEFDATNEEEHPLNPADIERGVNDDEEGDHDATSSKVRQDDIEE